MYTHPNNFLFLKLKYSIYYRELPKRKGFQFVFAGGNASFSSTSVYAGLKIFINNNLFNNLPSCYLVSFYRPGNLLVVYRNVYWRIWIGDIIINNLDKIR